MTKMAKLSYICRPMLKYIILILVLTSCASQVDTLQERFYTPEYRKTLPYNVDLAFIYHNKHSKVDLEEFQRQFTVAKEVFAKEGVNLHLTYVKKIRQMPKSWHRQSVMETKGKNPSADTDFYDGMEIKKFALTKRSQKIFEQLIEGYKGDRTRTIFVLALNDIYMSYFEKGEVKELLVGALSFPGYIFADRIPRHLRGVITTRRVGGVYRTLAHELGHKLFNVSHEAMDKCPKFSGNNIPGLMGYGKSVDVHRGKKGRYHHERLLLSPYLYQVKGDVRLYNPDYQKSGIYRDPIYGKYMLTPACKN